MQVRTLVQHDLKNSTPTTRQLNDFSPEDLFVSLRDLSSFSILKSEFFLSHKCTFSLTTSLILRRESKMKIFTHIIQRGTSLQLILSFDFCFFFFFFDISLPIFARTISGREQIRPDIFFPAQIARIWPNVSAIFARWRANANKRSVAAARWRLAAGNRQRANNCPRYEETRKLFRLWRSPTCLEESSRHSRRVGSNLKLELRTPDSVNRTCFKSLSNKRERYSSEIFVGK